MQRAGFPEDVYLDVSDLAQVVQQIAGWSDIGFSLLDTRGEPILLGGRAAVDGAAIAAARAAGEGVHIARCSNGGICAIAPVSLGGQTYGYLVGCKIASADDPMAQDEVATKTGQLCDVLRILLRKELQLEGMGRETLLRYEELNLLYEMGESIISDMTLDQIMTQMLERAVEITDAQGGIIVLFPSEAGGGVPIVEAVSGWGSDLVSRGKAIKMLDDAVGQALMQGRSQMLGEVMDEQLYGVPGHPVRLQSLLCVPLATTARVVGCMILVNKRQDVYFAAGDEKLSLAIAIQAAIAIENSRLQQRIREEERIGASLQRYVSPNVVRAVLERGGLQELIGDRWWATIVFVDIRDFAVLVEKTPPRIVRDLLDEYLREMTEIIFRYQGAIDEFAGDQLLAFFGIPLATPKGAENAVRAALDMVCKMDELRASWQSRGLPGFRIGVGMSTGWVAVANIGSEKRMELTVIGPPVVIASRVEELNKELGTQILVTQDTFDEVRDLVLYCERGAAALKGISYPVPIYEITGMRQADAES